MLIKDFEVGHLGTNCYIATDEKTLDCAVIDPGDEGNTILNYTEDNHLKVRAILITHGHYDHTGAAAFVSEETGAPIYIHEKDVGEIGESYRYAPEKDIKHYAESDRIRAGGLIFEVFETPGHSAGSVTLRCQDALFPGDLLFRDSCGRTDLPGGSMEDLLRSLKKIASLPGDYEVYPGHLQSTTLDHERRYNEYVRYAMAGGR